MNASPGATRRPYAKAALVLACAVLVPLAPFLLIGELPGERWLDAAGDEELRFSLCGAGLLALDVLLPVPSSIVGALLGGRLGFARGFLWAWLGLCVGHLAGYALGRIVPARFASELPSAPSLFVVLLSRPVPVLAEAVALAAGVERVPLAGYALSAGLGNAAYAAAMAGDGAALLPQGIAGPGLVLPLLVPVAAFVLWRALARRRPGKDSSAPEDP